MSKKTDKPRGKKPAMRQKKRPFLCQLTMAGASATLDVSGVIGWDADPMEFCDKVDAAKNAGCTQLTVRINSCGGYCYDGLAMGDKLKASGMKIRAEVCGQAMSMASYLLECAHERVAHPNATIMFHQPSAGVYGTVDEIAEQSRYLCAMRDRMFAVMAERCGTTGEAMSQEHMTMKIYSAQDALAKNMIDSIIEPSADDTDATDAITDDVTAKMQSAAGQKRGKHGIVDHDPALMCLPTMMADDDTDDDTTDDDTDPKKDDDSTDDDTDPKKDDDTTDDDTTDDNTPVNLSRAKLNTMLQQAAQQGAASALSSMGVSRASLPGNTASGEQQESAEAANYTNAQLDAMPASRRLAMLDENPKLMAQYTGRNH